MDSIAEDMSVEAFNAVEHTFDTKPLLVDSNTRERFASCSSQKFEEETIPQTSSAMPEHSYAGGFCDSCYSYE